MLRTPRSAATWKPKSYLHSGGRPLGLLMRALPLLSTEPALRSAVWPPVPVSRHGAQYLAGRRGWTGALASQPSSRRNDRRSAKLCSASAVCPAGAPLACHAASMQDIGHWIIAECEGQELLGICDLRDWLYRIDNVARAVLAQRPVLR